MSLSREAYNELRAQLAEKDQIIAVLQESLRRKEAALLEAQLKGENAAAEGQEPGAPRIVPLGERPAPPSADRPAGRRHGYVPLQFSPDMPEEGPLKPNHVALPSINSRAHLYLGRAYANRRHLEVSPDMPEALGGPRMTRNGERVR